MPLLSDAVGAVTAAGIRQWVRLTGQRIAAGEAPWLDGPVGPPDRIGAEFYGYLADREQLQICPSMDAGLLPDFGALQGEGFDPAKVRPEIRDFYEHTSRYRLDAWSDAAIPTRTLLWALTQVSRRMDQMNFPISSLELAEGMTNEILPMVDAAGQLRYTGWLRRRAAAGQVIYTALYSVQPPARYPDPCVKVIFPLPMGSSMIFLRPEAQPDGSFKLISSGCRFGDPGLYRLVDVGAGRRRVCYLGTLREFFHVFVDKQGALRAEHAVRWLGGAPLRLHYRLERSSIEERDSASATVVPGAGAGSD